LEDKIIKKKYQFLKLSQIEQIAIKIIETKSYRWKKLKNDAVEKKIYSINYFKLNK